MSNNDHLRLVSSLVDLVEGAAGLVDVDIDIGLEGFDNAPEVCNHTC